MSGARTRRRALLFRRPGGMGVILLAFLLAGCATAPPTSSGSPLRPGDTTIAVVAEENFWGSIASQLGGDRVTVRNVIANPDADPHDYEPTAADGRAVASAQYVIANGAGYDPWITKLIAANPAPGRSVLAVGDLVGVQQGGNPHRWYSPDDVHRVIERITADFQRIDPGAAAYFDQQKQMYETQGLARYDQLITDIKSRYRGTPIGASESIVTPLAEG
ncbi:MAG: metal ABC transporter solute-binding protein, Zn/Mn family, partial [Pseudonocardiaceae bacterium]